MTIREFDSYIRTFLSLDEFARLDSSRNGLQVDRRNRAVRRVAFAVDAALEVFQRAAEWNADLLFVHHGLFWGHEQVLVGAHLDRVRFLIEHDLALYAVHLPLDAHLQVGNNAGIAQHLGLVDVEPFGLYKGVNIGVQGRFAVPSSVDAVAEQLTGPHGRPIAVLPFGPSQVRTVGIISGGGIHEIEQAVEAGLDLYITGDAAHVAYHRCQEAGIHAIFAGHYATEVWGVRSVAQKLTADTGLATTFIDVPTQL